MIPREPHPWYHHPCPACPHLSLSTLCLCFLHMTYGRAFYLFISISYLSSILECIVLRTETLSFSSVYPSPGDTTCHIVHTQQINECRTHHLPKFVSRKRNFSHIIEYTVLCVLPMRHNQKQ